MTVTLIEALNPLPDSTGATVDQDRCDADLNAILAIPRPGAPVDGHADNVTRRAALTGLAAAGVAAVTVAGWPLLPGHQPAAAHAATPPVLPGVLATGPAASAALQQLAGTTERSTLDGRHGSVYTTWSLFTRVADSEPVRSAVVPQDVELTVNPDDSGRLLVRFGAAVAADGTPASGFDLPPAGSVVRDDSYTPGQLPLMYSQPLQADPDALWTQLTAAHPIEQLGTGELFVALTDLYKEQTPQPRVRAQLLRFLASRPDVRSHGELADRAGRRGMAVTAAASQPGGLPAQFVLIFDQQAGALLGYEQVLTADAGKLDVTLPAVIDYALFRR